MNQDLLDSRIFAKLAISKLAAGGTPGAYEVYANSRWPGQGIIQRAAVPAIGSDDVNATALGADVLRHVVKQSALGPMLGDVWRVNFQEAFNGAATGLGANWTSELDPAPISRTSLEKQVLARLKIVGLSIFTNESLEAPNAESQIERALVQTTRDLLDQTFLAGSGFAGETPGSIPQTAGVGTVAALSDPAASFRALVRDFSGQLSTSYFITDHETAAQLALYPASPFADVGVRGGTIAGLPLIVSQSSPRDSAGGQVVLLDASRVAVALGSIDVSRSSESSIWMVDELDSNPELVGLFQAEASALKIVVTANWLLMDAGACRVLTGCDWAPAV
ncbi:MAG: phage major capsid protein [Halioglobus sp.]|nr:phage major capsid protein [Halioglobus sp.]